MEQTVADGIPPGGRVRGRRQNARRKREERRDEKRSITDDFAI